MINRLINLVSGAGEWVGITRQTNEDEDEGLRTQVAQLAAVHHSLTTENTTLRATNTTLYGRVKRLDEIVRGLKIVLVAVTIAATAASVAAFSHMSEKAKELYNVKYKLDRAQIKVEIEELEAVSKANRKAFDLKYQLTLTERNRDTLNASLLEAQQDPGFLARKTLEASLLDQERTIERMADDRRYYRGQPKCEKPPTYPVYYRSCYPT